MPVDQNALAQRVAERAPSPAPLDRLRSAVEVADDLSAHGDALLDRFVGEARGGGCSWTEIGSALGVTKQAAHERFLSADQTSEPWPPNASKAVRAAFAVAEQEARGLGHNYLGTEHLLLGLLAQHDELAAQTLATLGITRERVLSRARAVIGAGHTERTSESLGLAPRVKRVLEAARAQARAFDRGCMGTGHLLLAICQVEDCVAAQLLADLGAPPERVVEQMAPMLGVEASELRARPRRRRRLRARARLG